MSFFCSHNLCTLTRDSKFKRISWTSDSLEGFVLCHSIAGSRNWLSDWAWLRSRENKFKSISCTWLVEKQMEVIVMRDLSYAIL
ncbi:hypothetical protein MKW98_009514 [Papaver atlanticum]|uniref:Uncharacterized protein n=1 Tax=Papaver atlanticum TaxID=357466 RepID=A0AAD4SG14_9MAGN|nr:hypothetical protein MKW98_009514 [Papaver atlanticum]